MTNRLWGLSPATGIVSYRELLAIACNLYDIVTRGQERYIEVNLAPKLNFVVFFNFHNDSKNKR